MTQEEKELLIKDLCSRLPYEVKGVEANTLCLLNTMTHFKSIVKNIEYKIEYLGFKPYLLPLSSMTEEQKEEYIDLQQRVIYNSKGLINSDVMEYVNWCYKNHIDINNLIPMGLAIDCTQLNIY